MPDTETRERIYGAIASLTLEELSEWLWAREASWGPVIYVGHTEEGTAATFRYADERPVGTEIRIILPGQELTVPDKEEVCRGEVFVLGALTWVAVFR